MSRKSLLVLGFLVLVLGATAWGFAGSTEIPVVGEDAGAEPAPAPEPGSLEEAWADGIEPADGVPAREAAICRLIPQCSKDVDCDAQCGAGNGNCVHSRCPIRVCRCK
jgi:hypothetical protein